MRCGKGEAHFSFQAAERGKMRYEFHYRRLFGLLSPRVVAGIAKAEHVVITDTPDGKRVCHVNGNTIWNKIRGGEVA